MILDIILIATLFFYITLFTTLFILVKFKNKSAKNLI